MIELPSGVFVRPDLITSITPKDRATTWPSLGPRVIVACSDNVGPHLVYVETYDEAVALARHVASQVEEALAKDPSRLAQLDPTGPGGPSPAEPEPWE